MAREETRERGRETERDGETRTLRDCFRLRFFMSRRSVNVPVHFWLTTIVPYAGENNGSSWRHE
jgi:hypothetical protein